MASHLPVLDVAASDVGNSNKAFGIDVGEVCFSQTHKLLTNINGNNGVQPSTSFVAKGS